MKKLNRILTNPGSILGILLPLIVMVVLTVIVYANTFHADFIFDSICYIVEDPAIRIVELTPEDILNAGINGKPRNRLLPNISFGLNYFFDTYHVEGYHLVNMIIHILTGAFIFLFFRKTLAIHADNQPNESRRRTGFQHTAFIAACFAAGLWLLHPVQTQAVTYIVQRITGMAAMFFVLSLFLYAWARVRWRNKGRITPAAGLAFTGCLLSGICVLISKENAGTLPIIIVLYEWFFFRDLSISFTKRQIVWIAGTILIFAVIALLYLGGNPFDGILDLYSRQEFTLPERLMTEWRVVIYYLSLLFYPHPSRLTLDYDYPLSNTALCPPTTLFSLIAIISLIIVSVYIALRKSRLTAFCILWFFITLAIESSVIGLALIFEHRLYLPAMMPVLFLGILLAERIKPRWAIALLMGVVLVVCGTWTWQRNQLWQTPLTLWQDNLKKAPHDTRVLNNLGKAFIDKTVNIKSAKEMFYKALQINPDSEVSHYNMALALRKTGQYDQAIQHYKKALKIDPRCTKALDGLGDIYLNQNNLKRAKTYFQKILDIEPQNKEALLNLGYLHAKNNNFSKAVAVYKKAVLLNPANKKPALHLAIVYALQKKYTAAIRVFKQMLPHHRQDPDIYYNIACMHALQNNPSKGAVGLKKAVSNGYKNWERIKTDPDLENLRKSEYYQEIITLNKSQMTGNK